MDSATLCHRRSPSSDRFLGLFSFSPPSSSSPISVGEELNEAEVFWTTDDHTDPDDSTTATNHGLPLTQKSGILAVLPDPDRPAHLLYRKPSLSSPSKPIPSIPRPSLQSQPSNDGGQGHHTQSVPSRRFQQHSAPMKVPVLSKAMMMERRRNHGGLDDVVDEEEEEDGEMLPPHELVARGSGVSARTTFSVLEGVGRTLKGRDLRQVRNAIWRRTGFLD
ncbi:uncharacterized protein LOC126797862 [Argentina anserina]|uniref:uncharacterized protein LOC126797862 n=1 Tax=Argentina anserina TaxID=57926 RepID=UPI00217675FB|nr:uncharacterized protein LOC126797862 [Potentilla anserina]